MAREFYRVECQECGNEQTIFSRASSEVECLVCGEVLATPQGGRAEVQAEVIEELSPE
ncbi:MAG: 30S ribosomal protein S27e [Candidatus Nanohaloarchaea archaeon]